MKRTFLHRCRLIPKVSYTNYRKGYENNVSKLCFQKWFSVERFWSGKIVIVCVKHHGLVFDFRRDWISDMRGL